MAAVWAVGDTPTFGHAMMHCIKGVGTKTEIVYAHLRKVTKQVRLTKYLAQCQVSVAFHLNATLIS
jgi:hypothetical protein